MAHHSLAYNITVKYRSTFTTYGSDSRPLSLHKPFPWKTKSPFFYFQTQLNLQYIYLCPELSTKGLLYGLGASGPERAWTHISFYAQCLTNHFPFQRNSKGKVPVQAMKTYKTSVGTVPLILNYSTRWRWMVSLMSSHFTPPVHTTHRTGGWLGSRAYLEIFQNIEVSCSCWDLNPTSFSPWRNYIINKDYICRQDSSPLQSPPEISIWHSVLTEHR